MMSSELRIGPVFPEDRGIKIKVVDREERLLLLNWNFGFSLFFKLCCNKDD